MLAAENLGLIINKGDNIPCYTKTPLDLEIRAFLVSVTIFLSCAITFIFSSLMAYSNKSIVWGILSIILVLPNYLYGITVGNSCKKICKFLLGYRKKIKSLFEEVKIEGTGLHLRDVYC